MFIFVNSSYHRSVTNVVSKSIAAGFFFVNDSAAWNTFASQLPEKSHELKRNSRMTTWSLAEDLLLVVFSTMDCTFNWPADGNETPPNNLGYMQLGFLAAAGSKERFEDVASYRQTSSEMETSTERMEKVPSPWPLMFLTFGGGSLMGRMLRF